MDQDKEFYPGMGIRSQTAASKRATQLKNWSRSATNKESPIIKAVRLKPRVQFSDTIVFLAAAQSGDVQEVERLVAEGADVNAVNSDGLTGLHQCCIDDDFQMVTALVNSGANIDAQDNEGWCPLHAATSCGHEHIVRFLLEKNANPALVNNEGDTPLDLADDNEVIADLLSQHISTHNIDLEASRNLEQSTMLADVKRLKNDSSLPHPVCPGGASLAHIAASKGYLDVLVVLLTIKDLVVDALDDDGWSPLHAAVYWNNMDCAELLVSHGADISLTTRLGDSLEDLVDPELADSLEGLRKLTEEANNRHRRYAVGRSARPSLSHSNSRDEMKSPSLLRRRSSKERSIAVHKLDKEREKFPDFQSTSAIIDMKTDEVTTNHNTNQVSSDKEAEDSNSAKEEALENDSPEETRQQHFSPPPPEPPLPAELSSVTNNTFSKSELPAQSEPPPSPQPDPSFIERSKPEEVQESPDQTSSRSGSPRQEEVSTQSDEQEESIPSDKVGSANEVGLTSSNDESSPNTHPKTVVIGKIKASPKIASGKKGMSPNMLKRVGLWENQTGSPQTGSPEPVKRYTFVPRTISDLGSKLEPKSTPTRRSTMDNALKKPSTDYKTSSLPRGATISPVSTPVLSTSLPRGSKINPSARPPTNTLHESPADGPVSDVGVASSGDPTPGPDTGQMNRDSGSEVNRSLSESETKRKQHARRTRQQRHPTQPVDNLILQRLLQQDEESCSSPEIKPRTVSEPPKPNDRRSLRPPIVISSSGSESSPPVKAKTGDVGDTPTSQRTKSTARRRPRKERRSTGLPFEAEGDEPIPSELADIVVRKAPEEDKRLQDMEGKVAELARKYDDATRAYEQERKEREALESRIMELQTETKMLGDTKKECQRLKDENSALIRVIGKLSRSPLPSSTV